MEAMVEAPECGERAAVIVGAAAWLALSIPVVIWPPAFFAEDAYFYLRLARSVAAGEGSTFNASSTRTAITRCGSSPAPALAAAFRDRWLLLRAAAVLAVGLDRT